MVDQPALRDTADVRFKHQVDPSLDVFRDGVAVLRSKDGMVAGHLATKVDRFWSPGRPLTWRECVWLLVTWSDGTRRRIEEDYPPWTFVKEVRAGTVELDREPGTDEEEFAVAWLTGVERDEAWQSVGILERIGAYLGGG